MSGGAEVDRAAHHVMGGVSSASQKVRDALRGKQDAADAASLDAVHMAEVEMARQRAAKSLLEAASSGASKQLAPAQGAGGSPGGSVRASGGWKRVAKAAMSADKVVAVARADFEAQNEHQLGFRKGDVLEIIGETTGPWWKARQLQRGQQRTGRALSQQCWVPGNFLNIERWIRLETPHYQSQQLIMHVIF